MAQPKKGKPKGTTNYSNEIRLFISDIYRNNSDWSAPRIRRALMNFCKQKNLKCPSESTVRKQIAKIAVRRANEPRLELWSLASVTKYPSYFPPEVIPLLLKMQYGDMDKTLNIIKQLPGYKKEDRDTWFVEDNRYLTVWQAMWIARLYKIPGIENVLRHVALYYAIYEESCESAGIPVDTLRLDSYDVKIIMEKIESYQSGTNRPADWCNAYLHQQQPTLTKFETSKKRGGKNG